MENIQRGNQRKHREMFPYKKYKHNKNQRELPHKFVVGQGVSRRKNKGQGGIPKKVIETPSSRGRNK